MGILEWRRSSERAVKRGSTVRRKGRRAYVHHAPRRKKLIKKKNMIETNSDLTRKIYFNSIFVINENLVE